MSENLEEYQQKRDFSLTPEPAAAGQARQGPLVFVVQKHRARQLHYDLRLEVDGVLKSWSVPKGPSLNPEMKHLAVMVEDHPIDYQTFEGVIPEGEYGAGQVIVWDRGTYSPDEKGQFLFHDRARAEAEMKQGLEKGKISIFLRGHKLKGSWTLAKIQKRQKDWLLIKHQDDYARPGSDILQEERSVLTGRTIEDVKAGKPPSASPTPLVPADVPGARPAPFPSFITPMLAHLADGPFSRPDWIFEPKLDGYRTIASINSGQVSLFSRRGNDVTRQYATLLPGLSRQPASELVLDGEIIAMDEKGKQCFQCLQNYLRSLQVAPAGQSEAPLVYYVFDILYLDGYDLRQVPLRHRKGLLHSILTPSAQVRLVDYFPGEGEKLFQAAVANGLEGVVAKQFDSTYESGRRSHDWLKVKTMRSDEFVIAGYSAGEGGRAGAFGALLLGYYDEKGKLVYAGHVGTGFDERTIAELKGRLDALKTTECPFPEVPPLNAPTTWVRPELVAEVKFSECTQDGRLRTPVFLRLREDKSPLEVRKSETVATPAVPNGAPTGVIDDLLHQLQNPKDSFSVEVEGNKVNLTNMAKVLWPETPFHPPLNKRHFLTYLASVADYFLPHLKDRPLTLTRFPDGIGGERFFQKHWNGPIPDFVRQVNIREESGSSGEYLICDNLSTLLWLGQLANIEFHTWFSRASPKPDMSLASENMDSLLNYPDFIIFDLDPYIYSGKEPAGDEPQLNREGFSRVCQVALWLKEVLDELKLNAFVKTSGKTGLHVYLPIVRQLHYRGVRSAAETIGLYLLQRHPQDITMEWATAKRAGKVFIDYSQNVRGKTLASVYSPRPTPEACVSTPLSWDELGHVYPTDFSILTLPDRLKTTGDLWAGILSAKRDLKALLG